MGKNSVWTVFYMEKQVKKQNVKKTQKKSRTDRILEILNGMPYGEAKIELELALTAILNNSIVSVSP